LKIFPELDFKNLLKEFSSEKTFLWIKEKLSPEQQQAVHEIGEPGLMYGPREMRLYPNGQFASHVLGGTRFNNQSARNADMVGSAGIEATFNEFLSDRNRNGEALQLSLDLTVQAAVENILGGSMELMTANGATGIVLDVTTGEIVSMVSLPDFDPNNRPQMIPGLKAADSPLFNRAVQGVYELGSTFKVFTAAKALDLGIVDPHTNLEFDSKMKINGVLVKDDHFKGPILSVSGIISESSNVGTAILATKIGRDNQIKMLKDLGLLEPTELELVEAKGINPLRPRKWTDISTVTISYGYGLAVSPLHLAVAYASLINGGYKITPTILKKENKESGKRIISKETSKNLRQILRLVVQEGTATLGDVRGYAVGGKTGTAEKQKLDESGYHKDRVISTFASFFPVDRPRYVLVVSFDEPSYKGDKVKSERSAGWTAVPVAAEIIKRIAPLLELRPNFKNNELVDLQ
jgi:cell division protein FtsI (penicillin-binding protein 3)